MFGTSPSEKAYFAPFFVFIGLMALGLFVASVFAGQAFWMFAKPEYWVQPAQVLICGALVARYWRHYEMRPPAGLGFAIAIGVIALLLWISPLAYVMESFWPKDKRTGGFDPAFFAADGWRYWSNVIIRFLRLVIVVPLVEEIFWRGFLLRWLVRDDFTAVPIGTFTWRSFSIVAVLFMFEHGRPDWPAALITGALFNLVAIRTRSLSACVVTHAVTNLLLGLYIMRTGKLGFW